MSETRSNAPLRGVLLCALLVASALIGCGPKADAPVALDGTWPAAPGDHEDLTERWTRQGQLRDFGTLLLDIHATFKAPAWRAAHAEYLADRQGMTNQARAALIAQEREASLSEPYEVQLMLATNDRRENDLQKGERASWRVVLVNDQGSEIEPIEITRDRRTREIIRAEYPHLDDFAEVYVARFPRDHELLGPESERFSLVIGNPRGSVELIWRR